MEYYHKLKSLVNPEEWKVFLEGIIKEADLPDFSLYDRVCKASIFKEEGELERLFITEYDGYNKPLKSMRRLTPIQKHIQK